MLTDCVRSGLVQVLQPAILGRLFLHFFIVHGTVSDWKLPADFFFFFLSYMALFLTGNYLQIFLHLFIIHGIVSDWKLPALERVMECCCD